MNTTLRYSLTSPQTLAEAITAEYADADGIMLDYIEETFDGSHERSTAEYVAKYVDADDEDEVVASETDEFLNLRIEYTR